MTGKMRIAVLGDFHLDPANPTITEMAMEDIRNSRPDLVVALGDFGADSVIGTPGGIAQSAAFLKKIGAPVRPILGNHDLQVESAGQAPHGGMEQALRTTFGLENSAGFMEFETFRLLFITTEAHPADICWQVQECYVSEAQFQGIQEGLSKRPGVPVIVFSHAPPLGCGLRTVHKIHVRSTNAYLDQNHDPFRIQALYRENPDIVLWFSGHYHLGHHHHDSRTNRYGVCFFHTQVHTRFGRDGTRQSRIIDIAPDQTSISTLDHVKREVAPLPDWSGGALSSLRKNNRDGETGSWPIIVGGGLANSPALLRVSEKRVLLNTAEGYLWDVDLQTLAVFGAVHWGCRIAALAVSATTAWWAWDGHVGYSDLESLARFARLPSFRPEEKSCFQLPEAVRCLASLEAGKALAVTRSHLWFLEPGKEPRIVRALEPDILPRKAGPVSGGVLVLTDDNRLLEFPLDSGQPKELASGVSDFQLSDSGTEVAARVANGLLFFSWEGQGVRKTRVDPMGENSGARESLTAVPGGGWLIAQGNRVRHLDGQIGLIGEISLPSLVTEILALSDNTFVTAAVEAGDDTRVILETQLMVPASDRLKPQPALHP